MSTNTVGCASRNFMSGIKLCPPAKNLASSPYWPMSEIASSAEPARLYSNGAGIIVDYFFAAESTDFTML